MEIAIFALLALNAILAYKLYKISNKKELINTDQYNDLLLLVDSFWRDLEKCSRYLANGTTDKNKSGGIARSGTYLCENKTADNAWTARKKFGVRSSKLLLNK